MVTEGGLDEEKLLPEGIRIPPPSCQTLPMTNHVERAQHWTKKAIVPFAGLTLVQFVWAGNQTLSKAALVSGIDPLFYSFYRNLLAGLVLAPFAYYLERDVRPKMTMATFGSINFLALNAILANQLFFLAALALTSPLFTSAAQNMTPVITFLLAVLLGVEKISFRKTSDLAKILGSVICIGGAVTMTLYKGIVVFTQTTDQDELHSYLHLFKHLESPEALQLPLGVLCVVLNCASWGMFLIQQGPVLKTYPALLSMVSIMELLGSMQMAMVGAAYEGTRFLDFRLMTMDQFIIILYGGIIVSGFNLVLQAWCVQQVGPFIVSLFNPIQTLIVGFLAVLILGDTLYMGILIGGVLIIGGFYIVIYAKQMERRRELALVLKRSTEASSLGDKNVDTKQSDLEEPLLS